MKTEIQVKIYIKYTKKKDFVGIEYINIVIIVGWNISVLVFIPTIHIYTFSFVFNIFLKVKFIKYKFSKF